MRTFLVLLAIATIPMPLHAQPPDRSNRLETSTDVQKIGWMQRGMDAVRSKLKDPKSADFEGVFFNRGKTNVPVTCGLVNAKNIFGGRSGYQRFLSAGKPEITFLEEEVSDFSESWQQFCE